MARTFSNAKLLSTFVADEISTALFRRGYSAAAAAAPGAVSSTRVSKGVNLMTKKTGELETATSAKEVAWIPDPVTGHYRPENQTTEIDPAELRAMLLKNKK